MNLSVIILLFILVGCASARRQQRFLDSTIITRDSIAVRIDSVTGDTIRYRKRDIHIAHTPSWQNKHGWLFLVVVTVLTVLTLIIKWR